MQWRHNLSRFALGKAAGAKQANQKETQVLWRNESNHARKYMPAVEFGLVESHT
jgi:hypothetical protein